MCSPAACPGCRRCSAPSQVRSLKRPAWSSTGCRAKRAGGCPTPSAVASRAFGRTPLVPTPLGCATLASRGPSRRAAPRQNARPARLAARRTRHGGPRTASRAPPATSAPRASPLHALRAPRAITSARTARRLANIALSANTVTCRVQPHAFDAPTASRAPSSGRRCNRWTSAGSWSGCRCRAPTVPRRAAARSVHTTSAASARCAARA
mmetsp:Transcript_66547/g.192773  ORF Transcript_66547/g.192773 Transcript_66547/m.192773 type:complete len:209 (+) Transcript_66547:401-1027(+)